MPSLRRLGLATDRPALAMCAADGTIIEVFEWCDGAIATAHTNPAVQAMWGEYAAACDYVTLNSLAEAGELFAQFVPIAL